MDAVEPTRIEPVIPVVYVNGGVAEVGRGDAYIVDMDNLTESPEHCGQCGMESNFVEATTPVTGPPILVYQCPGHGLFDIEMDVS